MTRRAPSRTRRLASLVGAACVLLGSLGLVPGELLLAHLDDHHHGHGVHGDHVHVDEGDHHHHDGSDLVDHEHELVDFDCGDVALSAPSSVIAARGVAPAPLQASSATDSTLWFGPQRSRAPPPPHPWQQHKRTIVLTV